MLPLFHKEMCFVKVESEAVFKIHQEFCYQEDGVHVLSPFSPTKYN